MVYAAFTVWLLLIIFAGMGVQKLWNALLKPAWVNWALLPGTIVSEMAYIFGCLITGGEIRRARIVPGGQGKGASPEASTESAGGIRYVGPVVAALLAMVACGSAALTAHALLGRPVISQFDADLPEALPTSWALFWDYMRFQVSLLERMFQTLGELRWSDWRVLLFVYLTVCLAVRLAPARRPIRPTLAAAIVVAAAIALAGAASSRFRGLVMAVWPLITYVWAMLLMLLALTLLAMAVTGLIAALAGKKAKAQAKA